MAVEGGRQGLDGIWTIYDYKIGGCTIWMGGCLDGRYKCVALDQNAMHAVILSHLVRPDLGEVQEAGEAKYRTRCMVRCGDSFLWRQPLYSPMYAV